MNKQINIQYGCGTCSPEGWINFDSSPTIRLQRLPLVGIFFRSQRFPNFPNSIRVGDVVKGLPILANSADRVYCSHVLEHLTLEEFRAALKETYRMLKPEGIFRLCLPDLEHYIREYTEGDGPERAHRFMEQTLLGLKRRPVGIESIVRAWLGGSKHMWMWDYASMQQELEKVGFRDVRRATFGDSHDKVFSAVETIGRWGINLGVACRK